MDGRCKTCTHWSWEGEDEWGMCELTRVLSSTASVQILHPQTLAYVHEMYPAYAHLRTREDFGCVQWEANIDYTAVRPR
jgi:hypothetical protein